MQAVCTSKSGKMIEFPSDGSQFLCDIGGKVVSRKRKRRYGYGKEGGRGKWGRCQGFKETRRMELTIVKSGRKSERKKRGMLGSVEGSFQNAGD